MTKEEKMAVIAESVEMEVEELAEDMILQDLENWDSVAVLSIISFIGEKFNRFPSASEILQYKTVGDLIKAME